MNIGQMKNTNLLTVDPAALVERNDIVLDGNAPKERRVAEYVAKLKNPYCYKSNGIIVKVTFSDCSETIDDRLEAYARGMYNR